MKRKMILSLLFMILLPMVTGCWNRRELDELGIALAMGFDKKGDRYQATVQLVNPSEVAKGATGTMSTATMFRAEGNTVFEAFRRMTLLSPRKIYLPHFRVMVIGEELAKEGIQEVLDMPMRDHEFRSDFFIVVARNTTAESILKIFTPMEKSPANKMYKALETSEKAWASVVGVTLDDLVGDLVSEGINTVLPGIAIGGRQEEGQTKESIEKIEPTANLIYNGMAVFKKDKLVGWLNEEEGKGYSYIQNKVKNTLIAFPCEKGGHAGVEIMRTKTDIKGKVEKGRPKIDVEIGLEGNVADVECDMDISNAKSIYEFETKVEQDIQKTIHASLDKAQKEFKTDIFGFGKVMHREEPKAWKELKKDWEKEYVDLPVAVKVEAKIRRTGTIDKTIVGEVKE